MTCSVLWMYAYVHTYHTHVIHVETLVFTFMEKHVYSILATEKLQRRERTSSTHKNTKHNMQNGKQEGRTLGTQP